MQHLNPLSKDIPRARLEIERMNPYSAPLEGRRNLLRLDFNENTIGPSPKVIEAIRNITSKEIAIYPEYRGLKEAFAASLNSSLHSNSLTFNHIGIFNGVDAAIHSIFYAYGDRGKTFLTTKPTFGYYNPCANMQGMKITEIPYEGRSFRFPLQQISLALQNLNPKILIICNPNNPTGTNLDAKRIIQLAHESPQTLIVIDELYEAFLGDSILPIVNFDNTPNLVVLRSLSKTSGLAGLRIGFAIGNPEVIDRITRVTGPYDINSFAVTAAFAAIDDQVYIDKYVAEVLKARLWVKKEMSKEKIEHHLDSGNYFLLWPKQSPTAIEDHLKKSGILVRNMKNKYSIDGSLRVSIGTTDQMKLFFKMYKNAVKSLH